MTILISAANGKTGRQVTSALLARDDAPPVRALTRSCLAPAQGVEFVKADLTEPSTLTSAMQGVETVIHYGPPFHPREVAMGKNMIDAASANGAKHFIFISVIHPEIDDLVNHQAKLAIEAYLKNSRMGWTILRPQHYMQNIDVARVVEQGRLSMPYPVETVLGHVDMRDLAEAVAKVAVEPGHFYATYDLDGGQNLSVTQIADTISRLSGKGVEALPSDAAAFIEQVRPHWDGPLSDYSIEGFHRLFGYYGRRGITGNPNVLSWLLGHQPSSFENYVRRSLEAFPVRSI